MKIKVGVGSLRNYQRMPYTFWGALGEFVDNSIQAYFDEKKAMDKLLKKEKKTLDIRIDYDPDNQSLTVIDNSSGIKKERIEQAFEIGSVINDRDNADSSLGQFNIGMKAAAIWMADEWSIETKRFDNEDRLEMCIVNEDVFNGKDEIVQQISKHHKKFDHFTMLSFEKLRQSPDKNQLDKTKRYLASTYREFLGKKINIFWGDEPLVWTPFILRKRKDGKDYKWTFSGDLPDHTGHSRRVSGWIGILGEGKTNPKGLAGGRTQAGFSIMRRGRMIEGYPDGWRPPSIFGLEAPNNTINQRITGEITFNDGNVSYDKSFISPNDKAILDAYLGGLYRERGIEDIAKQDLKTQRASGPPDPKQDKKDIEGIQTTIDSSNLDEITEEAIAPDNIIKARIDRCFKNAKTKDKIDLKVGSFKISLLPDYQSESHPFVAYKAEKKNQIRVLANMQHPYITGHMITRHEYFQFIILMIVARYKIEIDDRLTMDDYFEVLDRVLRIKIS